jgi:6-pyruvoyltetrahydropterin/6-carboxytetrahydropterin synthase
MRVYLTRRESFSAAHRLHSPHLTNEENALSYGKCNRAAGHGHNYVVEVTLAGEPDARTGMVMNIADLKIIVQNVLDALDHHNIDVDVEWFREGRPSTAENIAVYLYNQIKVGLGSLSHLMYEVKLWETEKNIVMYRGE